MLPSSLFRYILRISWMHQVPLLLLTVTAFLLEVVPLELQRRIVNDAVKNRQFSTIVTLCLVYAGAVLAQGGAKLAMNVYRGWISETATRDLRHRISSAIGDTSAGQVATVEASGTAVAMIVAEVEPVGGFTGGSISEPLLQAGVLATVLAYIVHLDWRMAATALALFVPQLLFVPLMQRAMNRRTGIRVRMLRQIGSGLIAPRDPAARSHPIDAARIDRVLQLNMGILKLKFTMNFLMNLCSHLQIVAALLIGGWLVLNDRLEVGGVVAFISGTGRLNDPWGDLVNYYRELSLTVVKYRLVAAAVNPMAARARAADPVDPSGRAPPTEPVRGLARP